MPDRLSGKSAVVTGGASGLGEAICRAFVQEGARVVIADIQIEQGEQLAAELGDIARFVRVDVTSEADVANAVDTAQSTFGSVDVMVNNAGIVGVVGPIADTPVEGYDATMAILLRGVFLGMKHAARVMIPRRSGCIISMSSEAGIIGGLGPHVYSAAKAGVIGLTKAAAAELREYDIRVNAIAPGPILTPMTADALAGDPDDLSRGYDHLAELARSSRPGLPSDVSAAAIYLADDESGRWIMGHTLCVDEGRTVAPGQALWNTSDMIREAGRRGI